MKFIKLSSTRASVGMWKPIEEGDSLTGILIDYSEARDIDSSDVAWIKVKEIKGGKTVTKDPETGELEEVSPKPGQEVGLWISAALARLDLEKYKGHMLRIRFRGMKRLSDGRTLKQFDVAVSEDPVSEDPFVIDAKGKKPAKAKSVVREDDEVPF